MVTLGDKIKSLRLQKGLTQDQLGHLLGVNRSVISLYESSQRAPTFDILKKLARIFHVSTDFLLSVKELESDKILVDVSELSTDQIARLSEIIHLIISGFINQSYKNNK